MEFHKILSKFQTKKIYMFNGSIEHKLYTHIYKIISIFLLDLFPFSLFRYFNGKIVFQMFKRFCSSLCSIFISNYQHVIHHPCALFNKFAVISMIDAIHFINQCHIIKHNFLVYLRHSFSLCLLASISSSTNYQTVRNTKQ